jgi:hypothetical protein
MHANARLTPIGRLTLCLRIEAGRPVAHVAPEMGTSRATGYKWWRCFCEAGVEGLIDRSSRPHHCPHRTAPDMELQIAELRAALKLGPVRIGYRLGVPPSTVHRVLVRLGLNRLAWMDRPTGQVIRRYERPHPGSLIHVDVKKLGKIPDGGGWKVRAVRSATRTTPRPTASRESQPTDSSTLRSTTTAGWPMPRSSRTSAKTPPPPFGFGPTSGTPSTASTSKRSSPTTVRAIAASRFGKLWGQSNIAGPGPIGLRPTAR